MSGVELPRDNDAYLRWTAMHSAGLAPLGPSSRLKGEWEVLPSSCTSIWAWESRTPRSD